MRITTRPSWIASIIGYLIVSACAGSSAGGTPVAAAPPAWIGRGSGAFDDGTLHLLVGVGRAGTDIKKATIRRSTADNRARLAVAQVVESFVADALIPLVNDPLGADQHVSADMFAITVPWLATVMISERWDAADGTAYALVVLELDGYLAAIDRAPELSAAKKEFLKNGAAASWHAFVAKARS